MSRNLADSLSKMTESCNLTSVSDVLDVSISQETNVSAIEHQFCEELATKLATTSGEVLANNLSKNYSVKRLTNLRVYAANLCREGRTECPKGRLVRRLARQSGPKVEVKLASDVLELIRYWISGEENQQLREIFVKTSESLSVKSNYSPLTTEVEQLELSSCLEKLESKFTTFTAECSASMSAMGDEIDKLRRSLELRDTKIQSLEAEIVSLKGRCKLNNERLTENVKEHAFELSRAKEKIKNAEQSLVKVTKNFEQINKKNLHTENTKRNKNEPPGRVAAEAINTRRAIKPNLNTNMNEKDKAKSKQAEESIDLINVDDNIECIESSADTTQNSETVTTGLSGSTNAEIKENSHANSANSSIEFVGVQRKSVKRIFLGGIKEGVTTEKITQYMEDKGINPTFVRLMQSKRKGTTSARVNVYVKDFDTIKVSMFWPEGVRARPWLSQVRWQDNLGKEKSATK